jgi:hypothetical protein
LYSPVDEELENILYFIDFNSNQDIEEKKLIKKKSIPKDDYFRLEDYFNSKLEKKLVEDLIDKNNTNFATIKKYGLLINEKI